MRIIASVTFLIFTACVNGQEKGAPFTYGQELGQVGKKLKEASGLAASINNPGFFWTLNDSGHPPEVFLIDTLGKIRLVCKIAASNRDWEDLAVGAGPDSGKNYLYVADIGDNDARFEYKFIYRFEEPRLQAEKDLVIGQVDTLVLRMPDGRRDTEAILLDPTTNDLFLVSKRENQVGLYRAAFPFTADTLVLHKELTLPMTRIVAGSISRDGREVLLKSYEAVYYWRKTGSESIVELMKKDPVELLYRMEPAGEAITWSGEGDSYYTLSESKGGKASLMIYRRNK